MCCLATNQLIDCLSWTAIHAGRLRWRLQVSILSVDGLVAASPTTPNLTTSFLSLEPRSGHLIIGSAVFLEHSATQQSRIIIEIPAACGREECQSVCLSSTCACVGLIAGFRSQSSASFQCPCVSELLWPQGRKCQIQVVSCLEDYPGSCMSDEYEPGCRKSGKHFFFFFLFFFQTIPLLIKRNKWGCPLLDAHKHIYITSI